MNNTIEIIKDDIDKVIQHLITIRENIGDRRQIINSSLGAVKASEVIQRLFLNLEKELLKQATENVEEINSFTTNKEEDSILNEEIIN